MKGRIVAGSFEDRVHQPRIAQIAGDSCKARMPAWIGYPIDTGHVIVVLQEVALQDSAEESSASGYQYPGHQEGSSSTKVGLAS